MDILKEVLKICPPNSVSEAGFEAANIVLYTKDKKFFLDNKGTVKKIVNEFKKRVELRPDPSITMAQDKAEVTILQVIAKEAGVKEIIFDPQRSFMLKSRGWLLVNRALC
jgi:predicted metal-dependent RNase